MKNIFNTTSKKIGYAAKNINTGKYLFHNENCIYGTASVIKIAIAATLLNLAQKGKINLQQTIILDKKSLFDNTGRDSGILKGFPDNSLVSLETLCILMISISDNAATNLLLERISKKQVNKFMKENGFPHTKINVEQIDSFLFNKSKNDLGTTTPKEFLLFLEQIVSYKLLKKEYAEKLISMMSLESVSHKIGRYLPTPKNYWDPKAEVTLFASKGGVFPRLKTNTDVAILKTKKKHTIIISIFTKDIEDESLYLRHASPEHKSTKLIAQLGLDLYNKLK